ncbi:hypothetical protein ACFL2Q_05555 [Thermodesulfobacteriota bacterium]
MPAIHDKTRETCFAPRGDSEMEKLKRLMREPGCHVLLVIVFLFLFGWPFLTVPETGSPLDSFVGLFTSWIAFILVLFLISRGH